MSVKNIELVAFLNRLKKKLGLKYLHELSTVLDIKARKMYDYRRGHLAPSVDICLRMAQVAEVPPEEVLRIAGHPEDDWEETHFIPGFSRLLDKEKEIDESLQILTVPVLPTFGCAWCQAKRGSDGWQAISRLGVPMSVFADDGIADVRNWCAELIRLRLPVLCEAVNAGDVAHAWMIMDSAVNPEPFFRLVTRRFNMSGDEFLSWSLPALLSLLKQNAGRVEQMMMTQVVIADEIGKRLDEDKMGALSLPAFFLSQWDTPGLIGGYGVDADARRGDCGPAALASMIFVLTEHRPTVDEVAKACGQPTTDPGQGYTNHAQLIKGAAVYGIKLQSEMALTVDKLNAKLREGYPSLPLGNYGALREGMLAYPAGVQNQDRKFSGAHWFLYVGYRPWDSDYEQALAIVNDTNFWPPQRSDGDHRVIPLDVWLDVIGTVSATSGASRDWQGLVVKA